MYSEEVDLCHRLCQSGWKIYWVPQATVVHFGGQSTQQVATQMFLQLYQSKVLYFRKRRGVATAAAYKLVLWAAALSRLSSAVKTSGPRCTAARAACVREQFPLSKAARLSVQARHVHAFGFGYFDGQLIASVDVAEDSGGGIIGEDALEATLGLVGSVDEDDHAGVE